MVQKIDFIDDWIATALKLLVEQFKTLPNWTGFLSSLIFESQTIEDVFKDLYEKRWIETAVGQQLDGLGEILGVARNNMSDEDFRAILFFQPLANSSCGQPEILITALKILTRSNVVCIFETFPAEVYGYFSNPDRIPVNFNTTMDNLCGGGILYGHSIIGNDQPFVLNRGYFKEGEPNIAYGSLAIVDQNNTLITDGTNGKLSIAF